MSQNKKKLYEIIKNKGVHPALIKEIAEPSIAENVPMQCSVGLEFELENLEGNFNKGVLRQDIWQEKRDGSLRGDGREFVLAEPIKGETIQTALENIYACCKEGSMVKLSNARTSMHMHVNVSDCSEAELLVLLGVCALADDYLFSITNANRKNSGYCAASTEALIQGISNHQCNVTNYPKGNTEQRYRSVNTEAINKYGSIEFRHFAVPDTIEEARTIVKTCLSLKQIARKITQELNVEEAANFKARKKLNKKTEQLTRNILTRARELLAEVVNPDYLPEIKKLMNVWEIQTLLNLPDKKTAIPGQRPQPAATLQQRPPGEIAWRRGNAVGVDYIVEARTPINVTDRERAQQIAFDAIENRDPFLEEVWPTDQVTANPAREVATADIQAHAEQQLMLDARAAEQLELNRTFAEYQRQLIRRRTLPVQNTRPEATTGVITTTATVPRTITLNARDLEILQRAGINVNG